MLNFKYMGKDEIGNLYFNEMEYQTTFMIHENKFTLELLYKKLKRKHILFEKNKKIRINKGGLYV